MKRSGIFDNKNWKLFLLLSIALAFVNVVSALFGNVPQFYGMCKPFIVLLGISLVIAFVNMPIKSSKTISFFAIANFGVYLIHDSFYMREYLWNDVLKVLNFENSPYLLPFGLACILGVYIVCSVIDYIRRQTVEKVVEKVYLKITSKIQKPQE